MRGRPRAPRLAVLVAALSTVSACDGAPGAAAEPDYVTAYRASLPSLYATLADDPDAKARATAAFTLSRRKWEAVPDRCQERVAALEAAAASDASCFVRLTAAWSLLVLGRAEHTPPLREHLTAATCDTPQNLPPRYDDDWLRVVSETEVPCAP